MEKEKPSNGEIEALKNEQTRLIKNLRKKIKQAAKRGYIFFTNPVENDGQTKAGNSLLEVPKADKNPTPETVKGLRDLSDNLYDHALWIDPHFDTSLPEYQESGNKTGVWSGQEGRAVERSRSSRKGWEKRKGRVLDDPEDVPPDRPQPPPEEPVWEPIFDTIRAYLEMLEQVRGAGPPAAQEARERASRLLVHWFDKIVDEHIANGSAHTYAVYLQSRAEEISRIIDDMIADSQGERISANTSKLMEILNQEPLPADQYEMFQEYMMGVWEFTD